MTSQGDRAPVGAARELLDLLKKLRTGKASWSLRQIAERSGVSVSYLSEILAGKKTPREDTAERLAAVLGATEWERNSARWHAERARGEGVPPPGGPVIPYRLQPVSPGVPRQWSKLSPSHLLATARGIVPFFGRVAELQTLTAWRDDPVRTPAALLVHGSGGQGKTRLARQFADQCSGWVVVEARHRSEPVPRVREASSSRLSSGAGVVVVVDYAERWPAEDLLALAQDPRLAASSARLLMISRSAGGWWEVNRTRLRKLGLSARELDLPPLALTPQERRTAFITARDAFAAELDVEDAHLVGVPEHLDDEAFADALSLHMAALVAVDAHARAESSPHEPLAMSEYLLDRERDYWRSMNEKASQPLRTPPTAMARAVFTATACGPQTYDDALVLLRAAGVAEQGTDLLDDHAVVYPSSDDASVLEPLAPDRLGEDFLALQTPGHGLYSHRGDPWATKAIERLLLGSTEAVHSPQYARRAITVLIEAAHRWPHLLDAHLHPVLEQAPHLLLLAGNSAMIRFAELPGIDMRICEAVESLLFSERHIGLDSGVAALVRRLTEWRTAEASDDAGRAYLEINLGWRLAMAGQYQEALATTESAVLLLRSLPADELARQAPALATSLRNLGIWLANLGRTEDALRACHEASEIYARLTERDPDQYRGDYATALSNEALRLHRLQQHDAAIEMSGRAVDLHRRFMEHDAAHAPFLAFALNNLAGMLRGRDTDRSVRLASEAIKMAEMAALHQPGAHTPTLAAALNTAVGVFLDAERISEAVEAGEQAVDLYRTSAAANPDAFGLKFAGSLGNLSGAFMHAGRLDEALAAAEESVAVCRWALDANPRAYDPQVHFAQTLYWLATLRAKVGSTAAALTAAMESARLTMSDETAEVLEYEVQLADLLRSLAAKTAREDSPQKARPANALRVDILRRLADHDPEVHKPYLAVGLVNLGARAVEVDDVPAAIAAFGEAADIRRHLAEADPAAYGAPLRSALYNLSAAYAHAERWPKVVDIAAEALGVEAKGVPEEDEEVTSSFVYLLPRAYAELSAQSQDGDAARALELALPLTAAHAARDPDRFEQAYFGLLSMLMRTRWRSLAREAALDAGRAALKIWQDRRTGSSPLDTLMSATTLLGYGSRLHSLSREEEALPVLRESVAAFREHITVHPADCEDLLAAALLALAETEIATESNLAGALERLAEAMQIRSRLALNAPEEHIPELIAVLRTTAEGAQKLGLHDVAEDVRSQLRDMFGENG